MKVYSFKSQDMHAWEGKSCFVVMVAGSNLTNGSDHIATVSESKHTWKEIESEMKKVWANNAVVFKGGEPLLYPDFAIVAKKLKLKSLAVYIETNGLFPGQLKNCIDRRVVDFVSLQIKSLGITDKIKQSMQMLGSSSVENEVCVVWGPELNSNKIKQIALACANTNFVLKGFEPGECADPSYNSKPETTKGALVELARELQEPKNVFISYHGKKTCIR